MMVSYIKDNLVPGLKLRPHLLVNCMGGIHIVGAVSHQLL